MANSGLSPAKKATIADVARAAGVSVATVSMVLSNKGRISSWTAQRVKDAIDELGYMRNQSAATLRTGKSNVIGIVVQDIRHAFCADLLSGLTETLEAADKVPLIIQYRHENADLERCIDVFLHHNVDGMIIITRLAPGAELSAKIQGLPVPALYVTRSFQPDKPAQLGPDYAWAAKMATEYLIKQGHVHIAWLGGDKRSYSRAEQIAGFCAALVQYGIPLHNEWIIDAPDNQRAAAEQVQQFLSLNPQVTAILCHNEIVAKGAIYGVRQAGRSVGKDNYIGRQVALFSLEHISDEELTYPSLSCVDFSACAMGRQAARNLLQRLSGEDEAPALPEGALAPKLICRESA